MESQLVGHRLTSYKIQTIINSLSFLLIRDFPGKENSSRFGIPFLNPHGSGQYMHECNYITSLNKLQKRRNRSSRVRILLHCHYGFTYITGGFKAKSLDFSYSFFLFWKAWFATGPFRIYQQIQIPIKAWKIQPQKAKVSLLNPHISNPSYPVLTGAG